MTAAEVDALKILSKTAEVPMPTEKREGAPKTSMEAQKRLEMASEELKLMESEGGAAN